MKNVIVTAEFVNLVPAHKRYITRSGSGSSVPVAVGRAVDEIFKDDRIKGKRTTYPIKVVIQEGAESVGGEE
jgi:hypothetical protein